MEANQEIEDQTNELKALGINVMDQFSLEQNVAAEVDQVVTKQNRKQKINILNREIKESKLEIMKLKNKENDLEERLSGMRQRLTDPRQIFAVEKSLKQNKEQLGALLERKIYIEKKLEAAADDQSVLDTVDLNLEEGELLEDETGTEGEENFKEIDKEKMIKEGKMTPFGTILTPSVYSKEQAVEAFQNSLTSKSMKPLRQLSASSPSTSEEIDSLTSVDSPRNENHLKPGKTLNGFERYLQDQINKQKYHNKENFNKSEKSSNDFHYGVPKTKKVNFKEFDEIKDSTSCKLSKSSPLKKRILHPKKHKKGKKLGSFTSNLESDQSKMVPRRLLSEKVAFVTSEDEENDSGSEYIPSGEELSEEEIETNKIDKSNLNNAPKKVKTDKKVKRSKKIVDDGYVENYIKRMQNWKKERLKEKHKKILAGEDLDSDEDEYEKFDGDYKVPLSIWNKLFKYQRVCVKWLWELHCQQCGGILGDEMGLGKTVMIISFLVGLSFSELFDYNRGRKGLGPVLIVSPATVLHQWVKEFHKWWPPFRVALLHDSGVFRGKKSALIHNINKHDGILITSYRGIVDHLKVLLNYDWHYIILDEGHKIRNPEAQITVAVKRFQTPHRLILSGSPIQNGLKELWSLFDFIFPGKLGTLPVFMQQFAVPITHGGYATASKLEVQTAFKCATVLRDTINPYLLRRMKIDVKNHLSLPNKNEQVLFCGLTEEQRSIYRQYLNGNEVSSIMRGRLQVFVGLINLRKICNHPDLYDGGPRHLVNEDISNLPPDLQYGWYKRSGKMSVLHSILKLWKKQNHKVLLFTQSRQMLCILQKYLEDEGYEYLKMDGGTSVGSRQSIIDKFNKTASIFVFLLTTRVGGLGVNLTGADRVVIFDPDWNPSTDTQARERAWRIGQKRHVTIYRLLTAGTIEEKIYHRQIFKQFLTNRVLKDPKQQRFFKTNDLYELFTLNEGEKEKTESAAIFAGTGSEIIIKGKEKISNKTPLIDKRKRTGNGVIKDASRKKIIKYNNCESYNKEASIVVGSSKEAPSSKNIEAQDATCDASENTEAKPVENCEYNDQRQVSDLCVEENNINNKNSIIMNDENEEEISPKKFDDDFEKKEKMRAFAKLLSDKISKSKLCLKKGKDDICSKKEKRKKKKSKERDKKGKRFEGERIEHLVKKRKCKYSDDQKEDEEVQLNKAQDDFVLQKLFHRSGVHTALSHDVILNSGDPDYLLLESEAEKVAREALKQVRMSRAKCLLPQRKNRSSGNVNKNKTQPRFGSKRNTLISQDSKDTKKILDKNLSHKMFSGVAYDEDESEASKEFSSPSSSQQVAHSISSEEGSSSGVLSSSQLLKRMKDRNRTNAVLGRSSSGSADQNDQSNPDSSANSYDPSYPSTAIYDNTEMDPDLQEHVDLLTDIRNFVAFQASVDGQASTEEVVQRFKDRVPTSQNHIFKALLNQICDFVRNSSGIGFWYIKEEFR